MTKEELEEQLQYETIPDIVGCMNENSKHNREGTYKFKVEQQNLEISFKWTRECKHEECPYRYCPYHRNFNPELLEAAKDVLPRTVRNVIPNWEYGQYPDNCQSYLDR